LRNRGLEFVNQRSCNLLLAGISVAAIFSGLRHGCVVTRHFRSQGTCNDGGSPAVRTGKVTGINSLGGMSPLPSAVVGIVRQFPRPLQWLLCRDCGPE